jgi:hypothetical protein
MTEKYLHILLSNVESNGTINSLIDSGLGFKEIADLTEEALKEGFIIYKNGTVTLSEIGVKALNSLRKQMKSTDKNKWISKEEKSKITKITTDFIFLPDQDDIP